MKKKNEKRRVVEPPYGRKFFFFWRVLALGVGRTTHKGHEGGLATPMGKPSKLF